MVRLERAQDVVDELSLVLDADGVAHQITGGDSGIGRAVAVLYARGAPTS